RRRGKKFRDILRVVRSAEKLRNKAIQEAVGPLGVAGNAEQLVYVARRLGEVYRAVLDWTAEFNRVDLHSELGRLMTIASSFSSDIIKQLESIPSRLTEQIVQATAAVDQGRPGTVEIMITLSIP